MAEFFCHDFDVGFLLLEIHLGVGCIDFFWGGGSGLMALIPFLWSECAKEGLLVFSKFMGIHRLPFSTAGGTELFSNESLWRVCALM